jgi:hypothetical protein
MTVYSLSVLFVVLRISHFVIAQNNSDPSGVTLVDKQFSYPSGIVCAIVSCPYIRPGQPPYQPYQADTNAGDRGPQFGYNLCNSTTEGPNSLCQTAMVNNIDGALYYSFEV